jgi:RNA polymerase sigma-32 factor
VRYATVSAKRYMHGLPYLTREVEEALVAAWIERRCPKARERLVRGYAWLADKHARRFGNPQGFELDDLLQEAMLALSKALDFFDPSFGVRFGTYASFIVRERMARYCRANQSVVRGPTGPQQHEDEHGMRARGRTADVSLDAPVSFGGETGNIAAVELLVDERPGVEAEVEARDEADYANSLVWRALESLGERERYVYVERNLAEQPRTLKSVGDELGLSRERVRQIEAEAGEKLAAAVKRLVRQERLDRL